MLRRVLDSFLFSGDTVHQPVRTLAGAEKTKLTLAVLFVSGANVLLLDDPTNNADRPSRGEALAALVGYRGAVLLVTHQDCAGQVRQPQRFVLMPDGIADW